MDRAFWQLTRGVRFNRARFSKESDRFRVGAGAGAVGLALPESGEPSEEEEEDTASDDSCHEGGAGELTLLGDMKAPSEKKRRKRKKVSDAARRAQQRREAVNHFRKVNRIHVCGTDVPDPLDRWAKLSASLGFSRDLHDLVSARFPRGPTPVQMQAIPVMLARRELLVCAPTGSGKTAAYLVPLVHQLGEHKRRGFRAVVVVPTRELALQIFREAQLLASCRNLRVLVLDNVGNKKKFTPAKAGRYDILISTPNRLVYLLKEETCDGEVASEMMRSVEWLIVDESDKLFESGPKGFRDQLAAIYRACDKAEVCRGMFSATLAVEVEEWCKLNLDNVVSVTIGARNTAIKAVEQKLVYVGTEKGKLLALKQLVAEGIKPPVLIFVQTKDRAKDLVKELEKLELCADVIHSDRSQLQRDNAVKAFRSGRVWVLVCTELMGRGIDFKGVNLVVNYDFPPSTVSYIHRIGRTGRAGRAGRAVTLFTDQDKVLLRSIATVVRDSGGSVPDYMLKLKKASRQEKRKLVRQAVEREDIVQESKYDRAKRIKKEQMIAGSKRRKRKAEEAAKNAQEDEKKAKTGHSSEGGKKEKKRKKQKMQAVDPSQ